MRNSTWLEALDHELRVAGVGPFDRAGIVVETDGFLVESGLDPLDHFGPAEGYAVTLAAALGCRRDRAGAARPSAEPVIAVVDVSKSYRHHSVLRHTSLEVVRGALVVLTGPNGAGKSTLLRIIAGFEPADSGSVEVEGAVGYVPQAGGLDPYLRPTEHFALFGAASGIDRRAAERLGIHLAEELGWDAGAGPVAGELSGGTRQKLSVIVAMLGSPAVLLLDEPYQGMDADSARRFWELLWSWQEQGGTALVSSHSPDALRKASAVVEIDGLTIR